MSIIAVTGGRPLSGKIAVQGSKNGVLPVLAATLMNRGVSVIENCPDLSDVGVTLSILENLGCGVSRDGGRVSVDASVIHTTKVGCEATNRLRSSVNFLGALLAREGCADIGYPGGCELGMRPIDIHVDALGAMGAKISCGVTVSATARRPSAGTVRMRGISVGATENAVMFACACPGTMRIENAATEPEICELADFLNASGYVVAGAGTRVIEVTGRRPEPREVHHTASPDRIAAATFICAVITAGGDILLENTYGCNIDNVISPAIAMGCDIRADGNAVRVTLAGGPYSPGRIKTEPYPGFPTDAQPLFMAASAGACGDTVFEETIFDGRFRHAGELNKMGADIIVRGNTAFVRGRRKLHGERVRAYDLRGGAAMIVAALGAEGRTEVSDNGYIDRGYERIAERLNLLGACAERTDG